MGKGAFGKVRIVERRDTGLTFALKYIRKDEGLFFHTKLGLGWMGGEGRELEFANWAFNYC